MTSIDVSSYPSTVQAFRGNEQRATVFLDRYSKKTSEGLPSELTPDQMWVRVANAIGDNDDERSEFFGILDQFKFVPGGRILAGAGIDAEVTYYNCYVIPLETKVRRQSRMAVNEIGRALIASQGDPGADSRESIFDTTGLMVDIMSRGGGVGINWSTLRPKGAYLKRVNGTTSGPVDWMDVASRAVGVVEQGGSRRGAAMFMLDDWHPDVLGFIEAKRDLGKITNANVSVCVSDAFMSAVENDGDWTFMFPDTTDPEYNTKWDGDLGKWINNGHKTNEYATIKARDMWRKMAEAAWASGEPGVVFLDRYNQLSTGKGIERIISVNPCGEQGLGPYSVCNLGAMNLSEYAKVEAVGGSFDFGRFATDVQTATRFLDRVVDKNYYFIPENEDIQKRLRRIGLGVMGLADALIKLGLRYGSPEAVEFTEKVFWTMRVNALTQSVKLAEEFGPAPAWDREIPYRAPYIQGMYGEGDEAGEGLWGDIDHFGLRNLFLLTQAPTGTTSILAGVNSGIEPYFAFEYTRVDRTGTHKVFAPIFSGDVAYAEDAPFLVTSNDVTVEEHIAMQAAAQKHIDSSVSKTINGPNSHTVEDVERAYTLAYKSGCKGVAYFRDGSGRDQVLYKDKPASDGPVADTLESVIEQNVALMESMAELFPHVIETKRPPVLEGKTIKVKTTAGTAYITVNYNDGRPIEVFINVGKAGSDITELGEAMGRLISLALRKGATLGGVANQLEGIGGNGKFRKPLAHALGEVLTNLNRSEPTPEIVDSVVVAEEPTQTTSLGQMCPDCNNFTVVNEENCSKCYNCGWSAC